VSKNGVTLKLGVGLFKVIGKTIYDYLLVRHCIYRALSGIVFELLDIEKYCDLEIWVRGH